MIQIDKELMDKLFAEAMASERKRMNYDMRTSSEDSSQRMLNALMPVDSTSSPTARVAIHKHPRSTESIICVSGDLDVVLFEEKSEGEMVYDVDGFAMTHKCVLKEKERIHLCPDFLTYGCVVPKDTWHTVEVHLPSLIFEAKDGKYGEDGSESYEEFQKVSLLRKLQATESEWQAQDKRQSQQVSEGTILDNCLGDLKKNIEYLIGMERHSGNMEVITPIYVSRMLNVPIEEVEKCLKDMNL